MGYGGNPPQTLSDVLRLVKRIYAQANLLRTDPADPRTGIEWIEGERYERQEGAPPRLYFVRTRKGGKMGPPLQVSARETGSLSESLTIHVWGAETSADGDRYDNAIALLMRCMDAFVACAAGFITWGEIERMAETDLDTYGEEYRVALTYSWPVPEDATIRIALDALIYADPSIVDSPADPDRPNGSTGLTYQQNVTMQDSR